IVKFFRNGTQYYVTILDGEGKPIIGHNVTMNINGVFYNRTTDENGTAKLNINLNPGNYTITVTNPENGLQMSNNIEVLQTLIGEDLEKTFGGDETYDILVLDGQGNPLANQNITINIHGVFYYKTTDSNGIAKLNINLNPGDYIATAYWNDYATSNNVVVKNA
ncbi:MAG: adhesin, partial [Methanobacteriaceae archaeon]|nr:adhesin [Methanobacteriaceae archaeon]